MVSGTKTGTELWRSNRMPPEPEARQASSESVGQTGTGIVPTTPSTSRMSVTSGRRGLLRELRGRHRGVCRSGQGAEVGQPDAIADEDVGSIRHVVHDQRLDCRVHRDRHAAELGQVGHRARAGLRARDLHHLQLAVDDDDPTRQRAVGEAGAELVGRQVVLTPGCAARLGTKAAYRPSRRQPPRWPAARRTCPVVARRPQDRAGSPALGSALTHCARPACGRVRRAARARPVSSSSASPGRISRASPWTATSRPAGAVVEIELVDGHRRVGNARRAAPRKSSEPSPRDSKRHRSCRAADRRIPGGLNERLVGRRDLQLRRLEEVRLAVGCGPAAQLRHELAVDHDDLACEVARGEGLPRADPDPERSGSRRPTVQAMRQVR